MQPSSNGNLLFVIVLLAALGAGAYFVFVAGDDDGTPQSAGDSQGIRISAGQPAPQGQTQLQPRPAQTQTAPPVAAAGDQVITVNMQFTQTLVRTDGRCPSNVPAPGFDVSPKTPTKVTINKTKRTIQFENSDGSKSDVNSYDAVTSLAVITYTGTQDNRAGLIKVTDTSLDGESTFFPYRGRQGAEQYNDCKFVLKTTARVV